MHIFDQPKDKFWTSKTNYKKWKYEETNKGEVSGCISLQLQKLCSYINVFLQIYLWVIFLFCFIVL